MVAGTILVVDDNQDDVFLLRHALRSAGFINPVQTVESGTAAIDYLRGAGPFTDRAQYPYPAFLLLDLHLPLQTGFEVLEWLRENPQPDLKVVVCTGTASPAEVDLAYALGAEKVLEKSADFAGFIKTLQDVPGVRVHPLEQGRELLFS